MKNILFIIILLVFISCSLKNNPINYYSCEPCQKGKYVWSFSVLYKGKEKNPETFFYEGECLEKYDLICEGTKK